ncbi:MAG: metallophosphoesterase [Porphyromonas sp.]|nr:metallophosphoesterase [Porphyromonas sp.]
MKVFLDAIVGQILFNLYIFYRGRQAVRDSKPCRYGLYTLLGAEFALYMIGFILRDILPRPVMELVMIVCGTWYFTSMYIVLGLLVIELVRFVDRHTCRFFPLMDKQKYARLKKLLFVILPMVSALLIVWGYYTVKHPVVTHRTIKLDKPIANVLNRLRVLLVTDIHMSETITKSYVERLVDLANEQQPDIVLIAGDFFDYYSYYGYRDGIPDLMRRLTAPLGVYYVLGNHEYRADMQAKIDWVPLSGGILLRDSVAYPGGLFSLIGRDDATNRYRSSLGELVATIEPDKRDLPRIVLDHQPWHLESLSPCGIDVATFGHTHNGQIFPFSLVTSLVFDNAYGYSRVGDSQVFVSCGFGAAGPAIRLFTKSEIVVLDLIGG